MKIEELESMLEDVILETTVLPKKDVGLLIDSLVTFLISDIGLEVEQEDEEVDDE